MDYHLTVSDPFKSYQRGDHITDPAEVEAVLSGEHRGHVVQRFPQPEHADGRFYMTDAELAERAKAKAEATKPAPAPVAPRGKPAEKAATE